jgi:hypothetical protein
MMIMKKPRIIAQFPCCLSYLKFASEQSIINLQIILSKTKDSQLTKVEIENNIQPKHWAL